MKKLTEKKRVDLVFKGLYPDKVPVDIQGLVNVAPRLLGFTRKEMATDPLKAAEARIKTWEKVRTDLTAVGIYSLPMSQAAGNKCGLDEEGMPYVKKRFLEEKSNLVKMNIPEPEKDAPLPYTLEVCKTVGSALKEEAAVRGFLVLPWTLASQLRGIEKLIYDTVDDPNFVHEVMRFCTEYIKMFGSEILDAIGEGVFGIYTADPFAGCSVISPQIYNDFVKPYQEEVVKYFKEKQTSVTFHVCGYIDPIMEEIVSTGIDAMSMDEGSSLEKMFEASKGKVVVIGNLPPMLFAEGTKEEFEEAVRKSMETASGNSKYILASGCAIPPHTPIENLNYFLEAADKCGRYDDKQ
jgi:uroporphyrinogen decarboxylase